MYRFLSVFAALAVSVGAFGDARDKLRETGMDALCDETWALYVDREAQVSRVVARDGLSPEEAEARIDSQMPTEERNARATHAINTDQPIERTRAELEQLYRAAVKRAG